MKRRIAAVLVAAVLVASSVFADGLMNKFRFSIETLPDQDGGGFKGEAGFRFSDRFASMFYVKQLVTAETGQLDLGEDDSGIPISTDSLNMARNSVTEYFFIPVEYSLPGIGTEGLTMGLGAYISSTDMKNVGYFKLTPAFQAAYPTMVKNNYYDEGSKATFYGPVLTVEAAFDLGFVSVDPRLVVVPAFLFTQTSSLEMTPLLSAWGRGEISYESKGFPYVAFSIEDISFPVGKLLPLKGLSAGAGMAVEMSRQSDQLIEPSKTSNTWTGKAVDVTATTLYYQANLGYKFENGSFIRVGVGQRTTWNAQEGGDTTKSTKPIYSIKYSLQK